MVFEVDSVPWWHTVICTTLTVCSEVYEGLCDAAGFLSNFVGNPGQAICWASRVNSHNLHELATFVSCLQCKLGNFKYFFACAVNVIYYSVTHCAKFIHSVKKPKGSSARGEAGPPGLANSNDGRRGISRWGSDCTRETGWSGVERVSVEEPFLPSTATNPSVFTSGLYRNPED